MSTSDNPTPAPAADAPPALPDYLTDPNAVLNDTGIKWRYGRAPDYSKTRKVFTESKKMTHETGSLPQLVENLVKNWEIEASFKTRLEDWRTIDPSNYSFAVNGGPPQTAEHMLKVGTYNAIIAPNEYYSPENSDFASSHKTFKRMMPTFAWEVLEVYSGPPHVSFRWRHWGVMKNDYVGFNDKAEKVTAKAHGGPIDIQGITVATVDDKLRLQRVETWMDSLQMFRQIAPQGIVNKEPVARKINNESTGSTPEVVPQKDQSVDTQHPIPYEPLDGTAVESLDAEGTKLKPVEQQSISDKQAEALPPASHKSNEVQDADGNWLPTESKQEHTGLHVNAPQNEQQQDEAKPVQKPDQTAQPGPELAILQKHDITNEPKPEQESTEASASDSEQVPEPGHVLEPEEEHAHESEQWHEAETAISAFDILPAAGCEPEKFHDALEGSIGSSEAGSWTNVTPPASDVGTPRTSTYSSGITGAVEHERTDEAASPPDASQESLADLVHPHPKQMEEAVKPEPGDAVAASPHSEEARLTHLEMSKITRMECPFLMNRE